MLDAVIDLVGDVNLRRYQESDETCLDEVATELSLADLRVGNLEGAFASRQEELAYKPGWHDGQPEMAKCLVDRFDLVACANNVHHGAAIVESLDVLDDLGILHTGAGRDSATAREPAVRQVGGGRVGMLAYTSVFEPVGHAATPSSAGVATIRATTAYEPNPRVLQMPGAPAIVHTWADRAELDRAVQDVRALTDAVDFVVVYLHFGVSMSPVAHDYQREIAHALIDAGAGVIAGSHSHTLGGVEFYGSGLVFYSLGNFIFNVGFHPQA
ncbi:MAG: CapA family protein, partial [Acidimicrobiaceae bacterium]|nr:CapA family protein [Acidimicrobiaceae bacterium]